CVILHDVDRYPKEDVNYTDCERPIQLSAENDQWKGGVPYRRYTGGVVSAHHKHWVKINGMSNEFTGWGGEDDEFYHRLRRNNLLDPKRHIHR
ncbi:galactosyltransferase-related protein, partial [Acinetobacter baumannii]|uniref:galactosyltransferase-related protein n=1 Tax=Acinetobacter baumannii TaxID=470 RepID=UPI001C0735ED